MNSGNSFCGPLRQPAPQDPAAAGCALVDMDALVASSDHLRNMQRTLSRAPSQSNDMPALNPVPAPSDDRFRFGAHVTRMRKSAMPAGVVDRMSSEAYPMAAPYLPVAQSLDTRWVQRGTEISAPK